MAVGAGASRVASVCPERLSGAVAFGATSASARKTSAAPDFFRRARGTSLLCSRTMSGEGTISSASGSSREICSACITSPICRASSAMLCCRALCSFASACKMMCSYSRGISGFKLARPRRLEAHVPDQHLAEVGAGKRQRSGGELEHHDAGRVDIAARVDLGVHAGRLLGRHERGRSHDHAGLRGASSALADAGLGQLRDAKVDHLDEVLPALVRDQIDVVGLDVAVKNPPIVRGLQRPRRTAAGSVRRPSAAPAIPDRPAPAAPGPRAAPSRNSGGHPRWRSGRGS